MNGKRLASAHSIVFQARPGTPELNCCSVNGPNGIGLIGQWGVLNSKDGLYLNYYGPGKTEVRLDDGTTWSFIQKTGYPVNGIVEVEVSPPHAATQALHLRIPEWSQSTKVSVNGAPVENVLPGSYLKIERIWKPGDKVLLELDLRLRALRGDKHVQFNTSLLRGPILLTFDQKYNTMDPADMPELDLNSMALVPLPVDDSILKDRPLGPIVALATQAVDGKRVVLCDFGSAGAYGTLYRSWLPVRNAPLAPFQLQHPEANAVLPVEDVYLAWNPAEPGSTYDLRIAADSAFEKLLLLKNDLTTSEFHWKAPGSGGNCYWQVESRLGGRSAGATNGPLSFTLDASVPTSLYGVVVRAALAGKPEPEEGRLLVGSDVAPAAGRDGAALARWPLTVPRRS